MVGDPPAGPDTGHEVSMTSTENPCTDCAACGGCDSIDTGIESRSLESESDDEETADGP